LAEQVATLALLVFQRHRHPLVLAVVVAVREISMAVLVPMVE
jgi:hypothetical protein